MHYFIVNVSSRTGKALDIWKEVEAYLISQNIEYEAHLTQYYGHATEIARDLCSKVTGNLSLIVVGGDGTANEVVNGLSELNRIKFGYIPTGSGNDLGRGLGIKGSPVEILENILEEKGLYSMDLGKVIFIGQNKDYYFNISSGIGIDAVVCEYVAESKLKKILNTLHIGQLTYSILTLKALVTMPEANLKITFDDKDSIVIDRMIFTVAMNHKWEGGGVPMAPHAEANDGLLSMCCVSGFKRLQALFAFPKLLSAKHENLKGFLIRNCKSCEIEIDRPMIVHTDGETHGIYEHIRFECVPATLKVYGVM